MQLTKSVPVVRAVHSGEPFVEFPAKQTSRERKEYRINAQHLNLYYIWIVFNIWNYV